MQEPTAPAEVTEEQQSAFDELRRELDVRNRLYPRWVELGKITKSEARDRYERLKAAIALLSGFIPGLVTSSGDSTKPF